MKTSRITLSVLSVSAVMAAALAFPAGAHAQAGGDAFSSQGAGIRAQALADLYSEISVAPDGTTPGNGHSSDPSISGDGRFVAFASRASNLIATDTNVSSDIFVRDRQTNTTTRVSVTSAGEQRTGDSVLPRITPDGRFVVFQSFAAFTPDDVQCVSTELYCRDIYLHDRNTLTTTRISVGQMGQPADAASYAPSISGDGRFVAFLSEATNLVPLDTNFRTDVFLRDRLTDTTTRVSTDGQGNQSQFHHREPLLSADGRTLLYTEERTFDFDCATVNCRVVVLRDLQAGTRTDLVNLMPPPTGAIVYSSVATGVSADGGVVLIREQGPKQPGFFEPFRRDVILDRQTGRIGSGGTSDGFSVDTQLSSLSGDGRVVSRGTEFFYERLHDLIDVASFFAHEGLSRVGLLSLSTNGNLVAFSAAKDASNPSSIDQIVVYDRDRDKDGMPWVWEVVHNLDPNDAADAALDPDGDGLTNAQEFANNSHPRGTFTRYFAEGAANAFFSTRFALLNPNDINARVRIRFLGHNGRVTSVFRTISPASRETIDIGPFGPVPSNDFATVVESDRPIVADRTVTWDATGYGGHTEIALLSPSTTWHFAEGATHGQFDLFYLLQNPNSAPANVTINYLRLAPLTPIAKTYEVPANGRKTIYVDEEGGDLDAVDLAAAITSDVPIVAERAMYSTRPGQQPFAAGHGGAGVTAPALRWFLAEGATGSFFDLFVLVSNPAATVSQINVTYLRPSGVPFTMPYTVGPQSRLTISVEHEDPRLADTPVSVIVESTNNQPVVVERAMWWPKGQWHEAHVTAGATETGTRWAVAEGEVERAANQTDLLTETYLLIANTSTRDGVATVTLYPEIGNALPVTFLVDLKASSRVSVPLSQHLTGAPISGEPAFKVGAIVQSDGVDIVVERAMYKNAGGVTWSWGTAALATKLQ